MAAAILLTVLLAQAPPTATGEADQLARVRRALTETPAINVEPVSGAKGPVFRVTVRGRKPLPALWDNWSAVPTNIRPWFQGYHHEYLERVTSDRVFPQELRGATLYPMGQVTTQMIESLVKLLKAANRKLGEAAARREVQQAIEEFRACQANRDRPGC